MPQFLRLLLFQPKEQLGNYTYQFFLQFIYQSNTTKQSYFTKVFCLPQFLRLLFFQPIYQLGNLTFWIVYNIDIPNQQYLIMLCPTMFIYLLVSNGSMQRKRKLPLRIIIVSVKIIDCNLEWFDVVFLPTNQTSFEIGKLPQMLPYRDISINNFNIHPFYDIHWNTLVYLLSVMI